MLLTNNVNIDLEHFDNETLGVRKLKKATTIIVTYLHNNTIPEHGGSYVRLESSKKWTMTGFPVENVVRTDNEMANYFKKYVLGNVLHEDSIIVSLFDVNDKQILNVKLNGSAKPIVWNKLKTADVAKSDKIEIGFTDAASTINKFADGYHLVATCCRSESGEWDKLVFNNAYDSVYNVDPVYIKETFRSNKDMSKAISEYASKIGDSSRILLAMMSNAKGKTVAISGYKFQTVES